MHAAIIRRKRLRYSGLIDYISTLASGELQGDLERADGYKVEFRDYDWSLNEAA
ncbi:MAG: hypothetical protein KJO27_01870 [Gammaproteobacteria bacterium]|nr:hypothetical protein [Gammaproteobacteria bacterium]NNL44150.1 hypothetical protein [Woeseiaceae bacterium]